MNNLLSPLIILHVLVIAINYVLRPFGMQLPQIPLSTKQYLGWPIFFACSLLLVSSTTLTFSKAWAMGGHQRQFFREQFSPKYADASTNVPVIPSTGGVAITFDDGWLSQYTSAVPIMDTYGEKGTFYIITGYMEAAQRRENQSWFHSVWQFIKYYILHLEKPDTRKYMTSDEVKHLRDKGEEIGAHTVTHPDLTLVSSSTAFAEIQGSKDALLSVGIPTTDFAYPSGYYTHNTTLLVQEAGFLSGKSADNGYNTPLTPRYALLDEVLDNSTTLDEVKSWIDTAEKNQSFLILTFHQIDESSSAYSVTPEMFQSICKYIKDSGVESMTVSEMVRRLYGT